MSVSTGTVSKSYISGVSLLDQMEIYKQIIDIQQDDEWLDFLQDAKLNKLFTPSNDPSAVPVYTSWENDALYTLLDTTGATVLGTGTATVDVSVLDTSAQNLVVVGSLLYFPNGKVARVQTVPTAASFTARSVDGTNLTLTAGMKLSVFSNAQEEGGAGSNPMRWSVAAKTNRIQIFSNSISITDVESMSKVEFEINGKPYVLPYEMIRGLQRHRGDISLAFWLGNISDTLFSDSSPALAGVNGYGVQTTRGMDQYITTYGISDTLATPGTFTLTDLTDIESQLVAQRSPKKYMVVGGQEPIAIISNFLKNLPSSGTFQSGRIDVSGREIDFEVEKFKHGGFEFNLRMLNVLSNTSVINYIGTGASKIAPAKSAYFLPMGEIQTVKNGRVPYFRYRHMAPQAGIGGASANRTTNGQTTETLTGGLAPVPTSKTKTLDVEWTSNMGLEVFGSNKFLRSVISA